jgi:hypothetical protein
VNPTDLGRRPRAAAAAPRARRRRTPALAVESLEPRDCPAPVVSIELPRTPIIEGDRATFTVRLSQPSSTPQRIAVSAVSETATLGRDFMFSNATQLLFTPGQTVKTFSVQTFTDTVTEPIETFQISATPLTIPNAATVSARASIYELVETTVTAQDVRITEGNTGTVNATFTLTLSGRPILPVYVNYTTQDITATAGSDYTAASGQVFFNPGQTTKTVTVPISGDLIAEPDETFNLVLSTTTRGCTIETPTVTGTIVNDEADTPGYQVTVVYVGAFTAAQQAAFDAAAARWSQVISGDLPGVTLPGGTFVDDIQIQASVVPIDGAGGVLGQAGPTQFRGGAGALPYAGVMEFDTADVAALETGGTFQGVIMHEMGHVLGLGTLWPSLNLVSGAGGPNPVYVGANAVREYNAIFGLTGTSVPVENTGGPGTRDAHWRESTMQTELMTGYASPSGVAMPLSRITVGGLADLGYAVNYGAADLYSRPPVMAPSPSGGGMGVALPIALPTRPAAPAVPPSAAPTSPAPRPSEPRPGTGSPSAPAPTIPATPRPTSSGPRTTSSGPRTTAPKPRMTSAPSVQYQAWGSLGSGR